MKLTYDPAMSNLDYERIENDFYATEPWVVENSLAIMKQEGLLTPSTHFWECACGEGDISKVLLHHRYPVESSDLIDRGYGDPNVDFLQEDKMRGNANFIFTNPPYGKLAEKFVRHANELAKTSKAKVGMILRNEWDCASSRMDLFEHSINYALKIVLTSRPRWIKESTGSPRHNYSLFFWDYSRVYLNSNTRYVKRFGR